MGHINEPAQNIFPIGDEPINGGIIDNANIYPAVNTQKTILAIQRTVPIV